MSSLLGEKVIIYSKLCLEGVVRREVTDGRCNGVL